MKGHSKRGYVQVRNLRLGLNAIKELWRVWNIYDRSVCETRFSTKRVSGVAEEGSE